MIQSHFNINRLLAIYTLWICNRIISRGGLQGIYNYLNRLKVKYIIEYDSEIINRTISTLNNAYYLFSKKNNCLIYSFALITLLNRMGVVENLILGVRTRPFFSHAWVECNGNIINDDVKLCGKLSVIMEL